MSSRYNVTSLTHKKGDLQKNLTYWQAREYAEELVSCGQSPVIHMQVGGSLQEISWSDLCNEYNHDR